MESDLTSFGGTRDLVCHIVGKDVQSDICIREPNSPAWAQSLGISWRAPEGTVTASHDDAIVRLVLREVTGGAREIEWNPMTLQVTLRRNELWSKPIYYFVGDGELVLSDSLRLVVKSLPFRPHLDMHALDTYLAIEFFAAPLTPFREIRKVGVEETCHVDLTTGTTRYVTCSMPERVEADLETSVEALREAFSEAIERRMRQCPNELILFCSGGLDSTILAHLMRGRGRAVVMSYVDSWKDEVQRARRTCRYANIPLQEVRFPAFSAEQLHWYAGLLDEPIGGTCSFTFSHLCALLPPSSWVVSGEGSGVLSLMHVSHWRLRDVLASGPRENVVERFCRLVTYMPQDSRQMLLGYQRDTQSPGPVEEMIQREWPTQSDTLLALLAVIRRQLCVSDEVTQIWPIYGAFGHTPVMPYFEPRVRSMFDRLPESVLRTEQDERRVLGELAMRYCPGYVTPPRRSGCGVPLGPPIYPNEQNMAEAVAAFSKGPLSRRGLGQLLDTCKGTVGTERFHRLRRLWTAVLLHAWLGRVWDAYPSSRRVEAV